MNKKIFISTIVFLVCIPLFGTAAANTTEKKNISYRHEVRVGVGEMFSDIFIRAWSVDERQNIFWIPNLYADYMYHFNHWLSAGLQVNTTWNGGKSRKRDQEDAVWHSYLYGVVAFMPTIRFTYFHTDKNHVALYSALHAGYGVGIDKTGYEGSGFTGGMTAFGISFGGEHLFGTFEIGGLFSTGPYEQICSRMLSMAIGYCL